MRTHALPFVAVFFAFASGPAVRAADTEAELPAVQLQMLSGLPVATAVYINGQGPFRFLVDTCSQTNALDLGLARKLGIQPKSELELQTPAGVTRARAATVSAVRLGSAERTFQEFLLTDHSRYGNLNVQGILGQGFLRHFDYLIDLKQRQLTFGAPSPSGERTSFSSISGCMVLRTSLGGLMLDSGTDSLLLFRLSAQRRMSAVTSANGSYEVAVDYAPSLRIGTRNYYPREALFHPVKDPPAAGLLPVSLFHAVYVSNSGGYVVLNP